MVAPFPMIGDILRKEREKQKLSVRDIEQSTSIRSVYIEALEKGEYDKLPGEVYAKGFIKNYGNFLNLDGDKLVRQFIMEISTAAGTTEENVDSSTDNLKTEEKLDNKPASVTYGKSKSVKKENFLEESNFDKYAVAAVVAVVVLIGGIFYGFGGSEAKEVAEVVKTETPQIKEDKNTVQPEFTEIAQVTAVEPEIVPVAPPPPPEPENDVVLQATFSGDCWTRITIDGATIFEGMINAGQTFDWKGDSSVGVLLGNAGAVQFVKNGQNIGALGAYGDVVEETFTR